MRQIPVGKRPQQTQKREIPWLNDNKKVVKVIAELPEPVNLATALDPFLAEHEVSSGSSTDHWYAVAETLELLLAGDEPAVTIGRMRRLPNDRMRSSCSGREVFEPLRASADPDARAFLVEQSRPLPEDTHSFPDLVKALGRVADSACHRRVIEMLEENPDRPPRGLEGLGGGGSSPCRS